MIQLGNFRIKSSSIFAFRYDIPTRNEYNDYCLKIIVWVKEQEEPFTYEISIIPPEYKTTVKRYLGIFKTTHKSLVKYSIDEAIKHPNLDTKKYTKYQEFVKQLETLKETK